MRSFVHVLQRDLRVRLAPRALRAEALLAAAAAPRRCSGWPLWRPRGLVAVGRGVGGAALLALGRRAGVHVVHVAGQRASGALARELVPAGQPGRPARDGWRQLRLVRRVVVQHVGRVGRVGVVRQQQAHERRAGMALLPDDLRRRLRVVEGPAEVGHVWYVRAPAGLPGGTPMLFFRLDFGVESPRRCALRIQGHPHAHVCSVCHNSTTFLKIFLEVHVPLTPSPHSFSSSSQSWCCASGVARRSQAPHDPTDALQVDIRSP